MLFFLYLRIHSGVSLSPYSLDIGEKNILATDDYGNANLLVAQSASLSQAGVQFKAFLLCQPGGGGSCALAIYDASGPGGGLWNKTRKPVRFTPRYRVGIR